MHFLPESRDQLRENLRSIGALLPRPWHGVGFVGGDFNTAVDGEARYHPGVDKYTFGRDVEEDIVVEELGPRLVELAQTEYTHVGLGARGVSVLSRIHRVYAALLDLHGVAGLSCPLELEDPVSDHSPVFARLAVRARSRPTIPQWVAEDAWFPGLLTDFFEQAPIPEDLG